MGFRDERVAGFVPGRGCRVRGAGELFRVRLPGFAGVVELSLKPTSACGRVCARVGAWGLAPSVALVAVWAATRGADGGKAASFLTGRPFHVSRVIHRAFAGEGGSPEL